MSGVYRQPGRPPDPPEKPPTHLILRYSRPDRIHSGKVKFFRAVVVLSDAGHRHEITHEEFEPDALGQESWRKTSEACSESIILTEAAARMAQGSVPLRVDDHLLVELGEMPRR